MLTLAQKVVLLNAGRSFIYLFREDFLTDEAAPLASPRTAEPGPGTLTLTETNGASLTITGGYLQMKGSEASYDDCVIVTGESFAHSAGMAAYMRYFPHNFTRTFAGFVTHEAALHNTNGWSVTPGPGALIVPTYEDWNEYFYVLRSSGAFVLHKTPTGTLKLHWVSASLNTASAFQFRVYDGDAAQAEDIDKLYIADLAANGYSVWSMDYGIATDRLAGARAPADTYTHEADVVLEYTITTLSTVGDMEITVREQDADNSWFVRNTTGGNLVLFEEVATVATQRATVSTVLASGHRVVVMAEGTTIAGYSNNVARWSYSSASNFQTNTAGTLLDDGDGTISDIVAWPRILSGEAKDALDRMVAG